VISLDFINSVKNFLKPTIVKIILFFLIPSFPAPICSYGLSSFTSGGGCSSLPIPLAVVLFAAIVGFSISGLMSLFSSIYLVVLIGSVVFSYTIAAAISTMSALTYRTIKGFFQTNSRVGKGIITSAVAVVLFWLIMGLSTLMMALGGQVPFRDIIIPMAGFLWVFKWFTPLHILIQFIVGVLIDYKLELKPFWKAVVIKLFVFVVMLILFTMLFWNSMGQSF
jgi:hypothetical protein